MNGSNDWVVSGAHTVTGKPLLSNDMHLGHQMPNLWYEAHLHSGALDVAGVTLPGMPYVIVGHNQRIAWGFTNVGPTVTDVYIENFNAQGAYQTPSGWAQPEHRVEVIHVKGKPDVNVDVKITRHGPVITELVPGETRPLALRWTLYDGLHIPFFDVNTRAELGGLPACIFAARRAGTERGLCRRRRKHRISDDGQSSDSRGRRRQPAGERRRQCA